MDHHVSDSETIEFLQGAVTKETAQRIREHLSDCPVCKGEVEEMSRILDAFDSDKLEAPSKALIDRTMARLHFSADVTRWSDLTARASANDSLAVRVRDSVLAELSNVLRSVTVNRLRGATTRSGPATEEIEAVVLKSRGSDPLKRIKLDIIDSLEIQSDGTLKAKYMLPAIEANKEYEGWRMRLSMYFDNVPAISMETEIREGAADFHVEGLGIDEAGFIPVRFVRASLEAE